IARVIHRPRSHSREPWPLSLKEADLKTIPIGVPDPIYHNLRTIAAQRGIRLQDIFIEAVTLTNPIDVTVEDRAMLMVTGGMPDAVVAALTGATPLRVKTWRQRHHLPANPLN